MVRKKAKKRAKKKPRGRPPLAPGRAKEVLIRLLVTPDMKERLEAAAEDEDVSMSEYIRRLLKESLDG